MDALEKSALIAEQATSLESDVNPINKVEIGLDAIRRDMAELMHIQSIPNTAPNNSRQNPSNQNFSGNRQYNSDSRGKGQFQI